MRWAGARHGRDFGEYAALWGWSVANLEDFWADIWEFCGVRASQAYERVLATARDARRELVSRARS